MTTFSQTGISVKTDLTPTNPSPNPPRSTPTPILSLVVTLPDHRCLITSISNTATIRELKSLIQNQINGNNGGEDLISEATVICGQKRYTNLNLRLDQIQDFELDSEGRVGIKLVSEVDQRTEDGSAPIFINTPKLSAKCKVCHKQLLSTCISCNTSFCINCAKKQQQQGNNRTDSSGCNSFNDTDSTSTQFHEEKPSTISDLETGNAASANDLAIIGNRKSFLMVHCNDCTVRERARQRRAAASPHGGIWGSGFRVIVLAFLGLLFVVIVVVVVTRKSPVNTAGIVLARGANLFSD
ncbi:hypothetical protein BDR26DRAFT_433568 [Obelidium mucronatum]|nr:hypothetical protein BDR26DRAFT_433568 [Obelidium mucronatum]